MGQYGNIIDRITGDYDRNWQEAMTAKANAFNAEEASKARDFNSAEAQKNRDFQEYMSNTAYQRARADLEAAGFNPLLAYSQGGASSPPGSSASGSAASASLAASSSGFPALSVLGGIISSAAHIGGMALGAHMYGVAASARQVARQASAQASKKVAYWNSYFSASNKEL